MSLQTVLDSVVGNAVSKFFFGNLKTTLVSWNANWPKIFNEVNRDERTVRDWFVPSKVAELNFATPENNVNLQATIAVLVRTIEAAIAAQTANRITAAQATALEDLYNATWP